jgi:hypothetical protein
MFEMCLPALPAQRSTNYLAGTGMSLAAFAQWRHFNRKNIDPIKQVALKFTACDRGPQVAVGGRDGTHINRNGLWAAKDQLFVVFYLSLLSWRLVG